MHGFSGTPGKVHIIQMVRGDYFLESIEKYINDNGIVNSVVMAGLGTIETCHIHSVSTITFPVENSFTDYPPQPLGVASVNGFIANGQPHIHMTFSNYVDGRIQTFTGHLEHKTKVLCRMEVMLLDVEGINLERVLDENGIEILRNKHKKDN